MRLSDYVAQFIAKKGVKHVFLVSGGGSMFLDDSIGNCKEIRYICNHHEQACAFAAEGYARMKDDIGVLIVTTGPGGTNAITGVAGAWLDSIPMVVISGQVRKQQMRYDSIRQIGDQEINIIDLVEPITKYSAVVENKEDIRFHLEKGWHLAKSGRPGPIWIDIPLDIQSAEIDAEKLAGFIPEKENSENEQKIAEQINRTLELLKKSQRPLIIAGNGIRLAGAVEEFRELIDILRMPVVTAINGNDLVNEDYEFYCGRPGIMGQRSANFAIQNCDLLISIGSRLMLRQIGFNYELFAREAKKVIVDIDEAELGKKTLTPDIPICCDAKKFIGLLRSRIQKIAGFRVICDDWKKQCKKWRMDYPVILPDQRMQEKFVNSYRFIEVLGSKLNPDDPVITTNGTANVCTMQCIKLKKGQRLITNSGLASMGYGLPAAIGACLANNNKRVICLEGDGSLQMNIHELQTLVHYKLPVKMFVLNNDGYLSIKMTQNAYFEGRYVGADPSSGVTTPDLMKIANAYGIPAVRINNHNELSEKIDFVLESIGPAIGEIMMDPLQPLIPKLSSIRTSDGKMVSKPLEDMSPLLPREEFRANMIVKTVNDEE